MNPRIAEIVSHLFSENDREAALTMLADHCGRTLPLMSNGSEDGLDRIRIATLKLSRGRLEALEREIKSAHRDWRDTLIAAGFGYDVNAHRHWMPS
jgi:hypothetical protein